jgi:predicted transposase YdaD
VDRCIRESVLKEYLLKKKSEVKLMLLTEFDEELFAETMREEGREEGLKEGREEGEDRLNQLYVTLMKEQKSKDLERAMQDKGFRDMLYERYGL